MQKSEWNFLLCDDPSVDVTTGSFSHLYDVININSFCDCNVQFKVKLCRKKCRPFPQRQNSEKLHMYISQNFMEDMMAYQDERMNKRETETNHLQKVRYRKQTS